MFPFVCFPAEILSSSPVICPVNTHTTVVPYSTSSYLKSPARNPSALNGVNFPGRRKGGRRKEGRRKGGGRKKDLKLPLKQF